MIVFAVIVGFIYGAAIAYLIGWARGHRAATRMAVRIIRGDKGA